MIKNGPKMRLNNAPGRRRTSVMSLPTKAVVRVQLLSGPSSSSFIFVCALAVWRRVGRGFSVLDQSREDFVEGRPIFATGLDAAAGGLNGFDNSGQDRARLVGDDQDVAWGALADLAHTGQMLEENAVEWRGGLHLDDVAAGRHSAQFIRRRKCDQPSEERRVGKEWRSRW